MICSEAIRKGVCVGDILAEWKVMFERGLVGMGTLVSGQDIPEEVVGTWDTWNGDSGESR